MKNLIIKILLTLVISNLSLLITNAQTLQVLSDSTKFYIDKGDFSTALSWAFKTLEQNEKEFGKDTNYVGSLGYVVDCYFKSGNLDSALIYQEIQVKIAREKFKPDSPLLATSINNLAFFNQLKRNAAAAEALYRESLMIRRKIFKEDNADLALGIENLANLLSEMGKFDESVPLYKEVIEMRKRMSKGADNPDLVKDYTSLARCLKEQSKYEESGRLSREAVDMSRRLSKGDNPDLAQNIQMLANFYGDMGNLKEAVPLFKESLEMMRRLYKGDHPELARCLNNLGSFYMEWGKYDESEQNLKEAAEMRRRLYKGDYPDIANTLTNLGSLYEARGMYKDAEACYGEALSMNKRLYSGDNPNIAVNMLNFASFYDLRGRWAEAEPLYRESIDMLRRLIQGDHPYLASGLTNFAIFLKQRGSFAEAEKLFNESLEMHRRLYKDDHPNLAAAINNVADLEKDKGNYKEAEIFYKESIDMDRRMYKQDNPNLATSIFTLANFYLETGKIEKAEPLVKESLEMRRRLYKYDQPDLATSIHLMAFFLEKSGKPEEAEPLYKEALEMRKRLYKNGSQFLTTSLNYLAAHYQKQNKYDLAEPLRLESIQNSMNMINNYFPSLSEKEKKEFWNTLSYNFEVFDNFAVERQNDNPEILGNLYDTRLYTKALLLNSSNRVKSRILNSGDSILIEKYKNWSDMKEFLVRLYNMTDAELKQKNFNIDSIEYAANRLEKEISLKSEKFAQSYEKKKVGWRSVQTLLKPDEAAIEVIRYRYLLNDRFSDTVKYAFLIVSDQTNDHPDLVVLENGKQLENEYYNDYREGISKKRNDTLSYMRYWDKLNEKIKGFKKIYFSADGIYNKLNPETLLLPDGHYLLDLQDIQQINTTKDLLLGYFQKKQETSVYNSAVLVGNPNFSLSEEMVREAGRKIKREKLPDQPTELLASTRGIMLTKLPGTEKEVKDIEKFLKSKKWDVSSYLGDMAVKTAVKSVSSPRVLHIATHGLFLEDVKVNKKGIFGMEESRIVDNPLLRSGLFFTGADNYIKSGKDKPEGEDNGILTAYEAMNLDLDKTELVVLSACETGLGEIQNGEGVFGLRRAFQQAGAKTIVMSLWTVSDAATQELMSQFYKNWVSGITKREAFSKAQLSVRSKYNSPYYWGAFVMVGE